MAYITAIIFFFGQLSRIEFQGISFPLIDIFIVILALGNILKKYQEKKIKINNKYFLLFLIYTLIISHFVSLKSFFYFIRLASLLSFFIFCPKYSSKFYQFFKIILLSSVIFGLIQYFFWPNFTYFSSLNWDPHLYRLVGTFFDPTFTGLIFLLFTLKNFFDKKYLLALLSYIALSLTYSRSSLLALLICSLFYYLKTKNKKIFITTILILALTVIALPRLEGEGTKLERTSSIIAKIENYKEGLSLFVKKPFFGYGYNNLSSIRKINIPQSHSNSGFDSSLLTILVTTGIFGFLIFSKGLHSLFIKATLERKIFFLAILVHSLFANSMFYPWTILFLIFIP
jgi:O-antigen ligase